MTISRLFDFFHSLYIHRLFGWLYTLFLTVIFGGITIALWNMYQTDIRLDQLGVDVRGTVTAKFTRSTDDGTEYHISYRYDAGFGDPPDIRTGSQTVSKGFYDRHFLSEPVTVTFLTDNRHFSRVEPLQDRTFRFGFMVIMALVSLGMVLVLVGNIVAVILSIVTRMARLLYQMRRYITSA